MCFFAACGSIELQLSLTCAHANLIIIHALELPPHHLIDNANVALDDLDYFVADVVGVVGYGDAVVAVAGHTDGEVYALQETLLVNAAEDEAGLVKGFGTLCAGADAHGGDGFADGGVEAALLGQGAAVAHHAESVHLQTVVVVEA